MFKRIAPAAFILALLSCEAPETANEAAGANAAAPNEPAPAEPDEADLEPEEPEVDEAAPSSAAIPASFHGIWDETGADCEAPSEYRLQITDREMRFHESVGEVTAVSPMEANAISVTADYEGEGETWSAVRELRLTGGGSTLTVTGEGTMHDRIRCPAA